MFLVTAPELSRLVPMRDAITAVAAAFASIVDGTADQPPRISFADGSALAMMARRGTADAADGGTAFKLVAVREGNRRLGLATIHALVVWFDGETGRPQLLVEGASLTALRTGAASGVATGLLAPPGASTLAMIGAGGQAAHQIRAVCAVREIERVRIFSPSRVSAERLAAALSPELPGVDLRAVASTRKAVEGADVVCCATNATEPVIPPGALGGRVHVNAIGAYRPEMRELPGELLSRAEIVAVDELKAAMSEAGEIIAAVETGALHASSIVEIGRLLLAPPAELKGPTVFKSVGIAVQDWAICRVLSERIPAHATPIDLWNNS